MWYKIRFCLCIVGKGWVIKFFDYMYFEYVYILLIVLWWKILLNICMWLIIVVKVKLFRKVMFFIIYNENISICKLFKYIDYFIIEIWYCFIKMYKERDGGGGVWVKLYWFIEYNYIFI